MNRITDLRLNDSFRNRVISVFVVRFQWCFLIFAGNYYCLRYVYLSKKEETSGSLLYFFQRVSRCTQPLTKVSAYIVDKHWLRTILAFSCVLFTAIMSTVGLVSYMYCYFYVLEGMHIVIALSFCSSVRLIV